MNMYFSLQPAAPVPDVAVSPTTPGETSALVGADR